MSDAFGAPRLKREGAVAHPDDIYIHCGCEKCEARWQAQYTAWLESERQYEERDRKVRNPNNRLVR